MLLPVRLTVLPAPTKASAKTRAGVKVTTSAPTLPTKVRLFTLIEAVVGLSKPLLLAVNDPPTVNVFAVIAAVVVGAPASDSVYFAALAPPSVLPVRLTVFPAPTKASAKTKVGERVTTSPPTTPLSAKLFALITAEVAPSYVLSWAVKVPVIVRVAVVMAALVVGAPAKESV